MRNKVRELTAEEAALLNKFESTSFGKLRKAFISALEDAATNSFGLENANLVCAKIKGWLQSNPAATPAELFRQLTQWLSDAKLDEGFGKGTRVYINKLVEIFTTHTNLMIDAITSRELASLDAPAPQSAQAIKAQPQDQSTHLKVLEDFRVEVATLKASITSLELEKGSLNGKIGSQSREIDDLRGEISEQKSELTLLRKANQDSLVNLEANKFQLEQLKQNIKALEELKDRLTKEADADKAKIRELTDANSALTLSNIKLTATEGSKDSIIGQLKEDSIAQKARIEKLESELALLKQTSFQATSENATLKARLEAAEKARDKSAADLEAIRTAKEDIAVAKGKVDGKLEATEKTNQDLLTRETEIVNRIVDTQAKLQASQRNVEEGRIVARRLMDRVEPEQRVEVVNEISMDISASGLEALGLDVNSVREVKPRKPKVSKPHGQAQAAGQAGHFKAPNNGAKAPAVAPAPPSATENGSRFTKITETKTPEEALEFLKPKILVKNGMSESRFHALLAISQFVTKHLTDKGVLKLDANKALYTSLVDASKLLVNPEIKTIESIYTKLKSEQPADLKDPLLNDFNEVLTALAVAEPKGENLQSPNLYWALNNFFVKVHNIKEMNTYFGSIYQSLSKSAPANGASSFNTSTLDATKDAANTTASMGYGGVN